MNMRKLFLFFLGLVLGATAMLPGVGNAEQAGSLKPITIVTFRPESSKAMRFVVKVQTEAFRRLGYDAKFIFVPGVRSSMMADRGEVDGELGRPRAYGDSHPNLIRVEEDCGGQPIMAYATAPGLKLNGWESLRGTSLRVEYQRGMSITKNNLLGIVPPELLSEVNTLEQGLKRLVVDRIDVYVDAGMGTEQELQSEDFQAFQQKYGKGRTVRAVGVMDEISLYPWLHRKHANLAAPLAEVLREMKADGSFDRYATEVGGSRQEFHW